MTSLPHLTIEPLSEEDGGYLIEFPDFPGCIADGETPEEAIIEGRDALVSYTRALEELGLKVPESGAAFAGQWRQRLPKSPHADLVRRAADEGVSLNMLVTTLLADVLARRANGLWPTSQLDSRRQDSGLKQANVPRTNI